MESDCDEDRDDNNTCHGNCDPRAVRTVSMEGGLGAGAGLEYDMWEGQFQFVGQSRNQVAHRWCSHLTEQVRRNEIARLSIVN